MHSSHLCRSVEAWQSCVVCGATRARVQQSCGGVGAATITVVKM